jgi:MobA/VirD2-like, nuclease domain
VKVTGGAKSMKAAKAHFSNLSRGEFAIETDQGELFQGSGKQLLDDWDLEFETTLAAAPYARSAGRNPTKLTHHVVLSMPAGTPAKGLLEASRAFAREQFALKHRYALVLHTGQPHPHVHLVVKAVSEQGRRLNIRKATLREWRQDFAQQLRVQGIAANATARIERGVTHAGLLDGVFRAGRAKGSEFLRERVQSVHDELRAGGLKPEPGKALLLATRARVQQGWREIGDALQRQGHSGLAAEVARFVERMPRVRPDRERVASAIVAHVRQKTQDREGPTR